MKRISLSKKIRFEVLKRDKFKCQYCGRSVDEVKLEVDHINPVAAGGGNDIINLITSCFDCNSGKSDRLLDDNSALMKQKNQLDLIQERREDIEMMLEWKNELLKQDDNLIQEISDFWEKKTVGYCLSENGKKGIKLLVKQFGFKEVIEAMDIAITEYLKFNDDKLSPESVELAYNKIGGICKIRKEKKKNPEVHEIYYIRGIVRNRLKNDGYYDENKALWLLKNAHKHNISIDDLKKFTKKIKCYIYKQILKTLL